MVGANANAEESQRHGSRVGGGMSAGVLVCDEQRAVGQFDRLAVAVAVVLLAVASPDSDGLTGGSCSSSHSWHKPPIMIEALLRSQSPERPRRSPGRRPTGKG